MLEKHIMQVIFFAGVQASNTIDCVHFGVTCMPFSFQPVFLAEAGLLLLLLTLLWTSQEAQKGPA